MERFAADNCTVLQLELQLNVTQGGGGEHLIF